MEEEGGKVFDAVAEESDENIFQQEPSVGNQNQQADVTDPLLQEVEDDIVLYPVAPIERPPTNEQVDVKISPAFQILDEVNIY